MTADAPKRQLPTSDKPLTVPQVCEVLDVSKSTFYYWRQTAKAPRCIRLPNGDLRIHRADLDAWLDRLKDAA